MGWVILFLVILAAVFGVLGAVIKAVAFIVLTILLAVAALLAIAWYTLKGQLRRWERDGVGGGAQVRTWSSRRGSEPPRDLPSHDDRY
jgi:hypothetical protein